MATIFNRIQPQKKKKSLMATIEWYLQTFLDIAVEVPTDDTGKKN